MRKTEWLWRNNLIGQWSLNMSGLSTSVITCGVWAISPDRTQPSGWHAWLWGYGFRPSAFTETAAGSSYLLAGAELPWCPAGGGRRGTSCPEEHPGCCQPVHQVRLEQFLLKSTVWACPLSGRVHCLGCRSASDWTNIIGPAVFSVQDQAELQPSKTRWLHVQDRAAGRLHGNHEADSGLHLQWWSECGGVVEGVVRPRAMNTEPTSDLYLFRTIPVPNTLSFGTALPCGSVGSTPALQEGRHQCTAKKY